MAEGRSEIWRSGHIPMAISRTIIMAGIGAAFWAAYLGIVWTLTALGLPRPLATYGLVPLSVIGYYLLVAVLAFRARPSWTSWWQFAAITAIGWIVFGGMTEGLIHIYAVPAKLANLIGALTNGIVNVLIQQRFTFARMAAQKHGGIDHVER